MKAITKVTPATLSVFATAAIVALRETGRGSQIVGYGDAPIVPYEQDGYLIQTLETGGEYNLPAEVLRRIEVLDENEIPYTHIITAHEIPKEKPEPKRLEISREVLDAVTDISTALGSIVVGLVSLLGFVMGAVFSLAVAVAMVDPIVMVRLASGEWLEIARYYE